MVSYFDEIPQLQIVSEYTTSDSIKREIKIKGIFDYINFFFNHLNLQLFYTQSFQLKYHHNYSLKEIENMIPFERAVYVEQVRAYLNEEKQMTVNLKTKWRHFLVGHKVRNHRSLRFLKKWLDQPNLWHFNRYSTSMGAAIGVFICFIPLPMQMLLGALTGIALRANLALAIGLAWLSNPVTMGPIIFVSYQVGRFILHTPPIELPGLDWQAWLHQFPVIWKPFLLGTLVTAALSSLVIFSVIQLMWHLISRFLPDHDPE